MNKTKKRQSVELNRWREETGAAEAKDGRVVEGERERSVAVRVSLRALCFFM